MDAAVLAEGLDGGQRSEATALQLTQVVLVQDTRPVVLRHSPTQQVLLSVSIEDAGGLVIDLDVDGAERGDDVLGCRGRGHAPTVAKIRAADVRLERVEIEAGVVQVLRDLGDQVVRGEQKNIDDIAVGRRDQLLRVDPRAHEVGKPVRITRRPQFAGRRVEAPPVGDIAENRPALDPTGARSHPVQSVEDPAPRFERDPDHLAIAGAADHLAALESDGRLPRHAPEVRGAEVHRRYKLQLHVPKGLTIIDGPGLDRDPE